MRKPKKAAGIAPRSPVARANRTRAVKKTITHARKKAAVKSRTRR